MRSVERHLNRFPLQVVGLEAANDADRAHAPERSSSRCLVHGDLLAPTLTARTKIVNVASCAGRRRRLVCGGLKLRRDGDQRHAGRRER
jgi:hypothetical protein